MKSYNRGKVITKYVETIQNGTKEFAAMRKELQEEGVNPKEINLVVQQVDKRLQRKNEVKGVSSMGSNLFYGGLVITALGLIVTIGTYLNWLDTGDQFFIAYGAIIGGALMAMQGKKQMDRGKGKYT